MVLNTDTLDHEAGQAKCRQYGGMLPEPRSDYQNRFLSDLGTSMFPLGMTDKDKEEDWRWDSDGSEVVNTKWHKGERDNTNPRGGPENCAVMNRNYYDYSKRSFNDWADISCTSSSSPSWWFYKNINLICQRNTSKRSCSFCNTLV